MTNWQPTSPIELTHAGGSPISAHSSKNSIAIPEELLAVLETICEVVDNEAALAESSRDWWPLALHWSLRGEVPQLAGLIARPSSTAEVVAVMKACNIWRVPVTASGGRSGVCGAAVPVFGGVILDMTGLAGVRSVDTESGIVEVLPGTSGPDLESAINSVNGLTVGHFPQSFDLATVGGWVASRGAGQYSTRYGKIEEMVVGLEVVLADGTVMRTGGAPAAAAGPDLTELIVGSEGTLGIITNVWLKAHPLAAAERRAAYIFPSFKDGIEACRATLRAGATPAVLRLYDGPESARGRGGDGSNCALLVLDEGDARLVDATMDIVGGACVSAGGEPGDIELVEAWMQHRNDTSALQGLTRKGFVVDTMEIAAPWSKLTTIFDAVRKAIGEIHHARAATCHLSHSYADGACLYFTFAATPPPDEIESTYIAMWDAGTRAVLASGGNLSHHHGVGLNRSRFMSEALGPALGVLQRVKDALDPNGILNPGKLGFTSPFGETPWP